MNEKLLRDFLAFSQIQKSTWDIDPTYPLLKKVYEHYDYEQEIALWHTIVYVAFYHLGSAEIFLKKYPYPKANLKWDTSLSTGIERRGFRGRPDLVQEHLHDLCRRFLPLTKWIKRLVDCTDHRDARWAYIRQSYASIAYSGPWSSYKFADLLKWVHGYDITAPDFGVGGGSKTAGPIAGLAAITGQDVKKCRDLEVQESFYRYCNIRMPIPFNGMDQCETCLCDFNSMLKGHYYPGHDIDQQLEFLRSQDMRIYLDLRKEIFPHSTLGELNGWSGVRKNLKRQYRLYGTLYDSFQPQGNVG